MPKLDCCCLLTAATSTTITILVSVYVTGMAPCPHHVPPVLQGRLTSLGVTTPAPTGPVMRG